MYLGDGPMSQINRYLCVGVFWSTNDTYGYLKASDHCYDRSCNPLRWHEQQYSSTTCVQIRVVHPLLVFGVEYSLADSYHTILPHRGNRGKGVSIFSSRLKLLQYWNGGNVLWKFTFSLTSSKTVIHLRMVQRIAFAEFTHGRTTHFISHHKHYSQLIHEYGSIAATILGDASTTSVMQQSISWF